MIELITKREGLDSDSSSEEEEEEEEGKAKEYYDSLEVNGEKGKGFFVFHKHFALATHLITYTLA